jgi:hypothetical protein
MSFDLSSFILFTAIILGWLIFILWVAYEYRLFSRIPRAKKSASLPTKPLVSNLPVATSKGVVLSLEVPRENEKTPLAAEALFASLHGIYQQAESADYFSFEIDAREKSIAFYVWVPSHLQGYVEGQLYAQYPEINIKEIPDYFGASNFDHVWSAELGLEKDDIIPIKTFQNFEVDPLAAVTAAMSKLSPTERLTAQILIKPADNSWRDQALKYIEKIRSGVSPTTILKEVGKELSQVLSGAAAKPAEGPKGLPPGVEEVLKAIEEKSTKLGFKTGIRLISQGQDEEMVKSRLQLMVAAFKQFNSNSQNGIKVASSTDSKEILTQVAGRAFSATSFTMNVSELASIWHLPNISVSTPNISWAGSKKGEPPANLPLVTSDNENEVTTLAETNFRGSNEKFGIKTKDRRRHIYVVGKSGVGKSTLLENMTISDVRAKRGVAVIDPHGDYIETILNNVPSYRMNDVIVFDVSDTENPIAFNVLEVRDPSYKTAVASGVVSVFKKIFGDSWGPRLEYWLRNTILALLDYPDATLMMIPKVLADPAFRRKVIDSIKDPVLKSSWENEFERMQDKQKSETIDPILNKVGQFLSLKIIRNIVGQPHSTINMREVMDSGKILLVKLPKGTIGEDNASLLGAFIVTQIQLAALSRADIPEEERRDFYLYVDEFQNFATESFETILSEARKYHLSLTIAHQYMAQLLPEVLNAVIGNVGTIISFRVGPDDASQMAREFAPVFDENDVVNLSIYSIYVKLSIDGLTNAAFSAATLPLPEDSRTQNKEKIIEISREHYSRRRDFVENKIQEFATQIDEASAAFYDKKKPAGKWGGGGGSFGGGSAAKFTPHPTSLAPTDGLADVVKKMEAKTKEPATPEVTEELTKALTEDGGATSFKEAFARANQPKEAKVESTDIPLAQTPPKEETKADETGQL